MDSSSARTNYSHHHQNQKQKQNKHIAKVVLKQCDTVKNPSRSSRRSGSFSSSSSSFSPSSSSLESLYFHDEPLLFSPASPPLRFSSGVPFSWEHFPGIPKKQSSKKKLQESSSSSSMKLLPLMPPPTTTNHHHSQEVINRVRKKNMIQRSFQRDPFFAALVECSKDDQESTRRSSNSNNFWGGPKVTRSISDRFGFIGLYTSCKRTCAVSESIVYLPSSRRTTYEHVTRRSL